MAGLQTLQCVYNIHIWYLLYIPETYTYIEKCNNFWWTLISIYFFYCWGEFLKCSAGVYTFLFISKIHPNTEIRDRNLSPSKIVTFLCFSKADQVMPECKKKFEIFSSLHQNSVWNFFLNTLISTLEASLHCNFSRILAHCETEPNQGSCRADT